MILGIDVGGTFTDFVHLDDTGQVSIHKLLTSARDQSIAILQGISDLGAGPDTIIVHGATVATNALLERRGARTALVTTEGFADVLEIGRQARPDLYALHPTRPAPLVPAQLRFELPERVAPSRAVTPPDAAPSPAPAAGIVLLPLTREATDAVVRRILEQGVDAVAISFLFSFLNPAHERLVRDRLAELGGEKAPYISISSEVLPEYREYERTSTTVINAYVGPLTDRYLANLEEGLAGRRLRIMQSNGGIISAGAARILASRTALSGPAGGVVGAFEVARRAGFERVITFDMGGTSTDVSLCPGRIQETTEGAVAGLPLRLPIIDIHTVGAGGGSIAHIDPGGALRVGPESAGSDPGPVCYGLTSEDGRRLARDITVTDANLVLGRLDADHFLGGRMKLDEGPARVHMQDLARRLSLPLEAAAWGVIQVANSNMERAIRHISIERGHDPRRFVLVAFGGAGPLHACELAQGLHIPRVVIPPHPGVLSALGMVLADVVKDYSQTVMLPAGRLDTATLERLFEPILARARSELLDEGLIQAEIQLLPALDMRYRGQSYELTIPLLGPRLDVGQAVDDFHQAHQRRFSYADAAEPVEVVNLRLKAVGKTSKPAFGRVPSGGLNPRAAHAGYKQVYFADPHSPRAARPVPTALYERARLLPGNIVVGPAVIFQMDTTSVIPPRWAAAVDEWGNLIVEIGRV